MQNTKISVSDWELSISSLLVSKHEAMSWAVHWFHTKALVFNFGHKHIVFVVGIMTRGFPKFQVENIWRDDLRVSSHSVLLSNQLSQLVVNLSTLWIHETASWGKWVHVEEILGSSNSSMVSLGSLLDQVDVLVHLFF